MKFIFFVIFVLVSFFLAGCETVSSSSQANWRQEGYDNEGRRVGAKVQSGELKRSEGNLEMFSAARAYFPNDPLLIGTWEELVDLAIQVETGKISEQKYQDLFEMKWSRFESINRERHAAAAAEAERLRRIQFISQTLNNMGNSMQRNYPPPVTCNSYRVGAQVVSTCQ
jgi:hypothetical protein